MCEKMSPSARGLTEGKLQKIEESVSVKVARGGARSDVVSLPLSGEDLGGLCGFWIEGHRVVKVEWCCGPS